MSDSVTCDSFAAIIDDFNHTFHIVLSNVKCSARLPHLWIITAISEIQYFQYTFFESITQNNRISAVNENFITQCETN